MVSDNKGTTFALMRTACLLFFLLLTQFSQAQGEQIDIVQARELSGASNSRGKFQRLLGNVILRQGNIIMNCDSAWLDQIRNSFEAFGNVHINQADSVTLDGGYLRYEGNEKKAFIRENVVLQDKDMTLKTDQLDYDVKEKTGYYTTGGDIVNREDHLTSVIGSYNANSKSFAFKRNVILINPDYTMKSDTLVYNTISKTAYFFGPTTISGEQGLIYCENGWYNTTDNRARFSRNAFIHNKEYKLEADSLIYGGDYGIDTALSNIILTDTINRLDIRGNTGIYDRNRKIATVTGRASAGIGMDEDSLHIHGDTLQSVTDTGAGGSRHIYAYHHVRFFKPDVQGVCDSLHYSQADSMIWMLGEPVLWNNNYQITADTSRILLSENRIKRAYFIRNSFIIEQTDTLLFNQVSGRKSIIEFDSNSMRSAFIDGNASSLYFLEEDDSTVSGVFRVNSSSMLIEVDSNEVSGITFYESPQGNLLPLRSEPGPDEHKLDGFIWLDYLRPLNREDIFHHRLRKKPGDRF